METTTTTTTEAVEVKKKLNDFIEKGKSMSDSVRDYKNYLRNK